MRNKLYFQSVLLCGAAALTTGDTVSAKSLTDSQILGIYIQVNGFDIETALLGRAQAKSDSIRKLATHVAADHLGVRQQAYALAGQCKVPISLPGERDTEAMEHDKAMAQLQSVTGDSFDKAYAQHEVAFHRSAIAAVRTALLPAATCPALKSHLNSVLPASSITSRRPKPRNANLRLVRSNTPLAPQDAAALT